MRPLLHLCSLLWSGLRLRLRLRQLLLSCSVFPVDLKIAWRNGVLLALLLLLQMLGVRLSSLPTLLLLRRG